MTDANQRTTAEQLADTDGKRTDGDPTNGSHADQGASGVLFVTNPSAKPTAVKLGLTALVGLAVVGYLLSRPDLLGGPEATQIGVYVVAFVFVVAVARLLVRVYLLTRFRYVVTEDALRREYSLLYSSKSRELPLEKVRGYERTQSRVQTALNVGTVGFLTAADARGIGFLAFENVPESERVQALIRRHVEREQY
ncbi:PH domain-containing protein [Salinigranum marinum]|uniref:PH domain-containing protein n=1 Tax=Salinigranum marinum TaxID=1515595 RepID=UPI002989A472|nr:PH domain-containing protein [Salinigranum marinum]